MDDCGSSESQHLQLFTIPNGMQYWTGQGRLQAPMTTCVGMDVLCTSIGDNMYAPNRNIVRDASKNYALAYINSLSLPKLAKVIKVMLHRLHGP